MRQATRDGATRPDRAERRAAVLDDPRFERFRNRRSRRRLVLALVALLVVEAGVLAGFATAGSPGAAAALGAAVLLLVIGFVVLLGALKASTRGVEELPRAVLDEREVQVRGEVYARAYRLGSALLSALLVGLAAAAVVGWSVPEELVLAGTVVTFHVAIVLPTLVAAWLAD